MDHVKIKQKLEEIEKGVREIWAIIDGFRVIGQIETAKKLEDSISLIARAKITLTSLVKE